MAYPDAGRIGKSELVRVIFCHILCVSQHHLYDEHIPGMFPYGDPTSRVAFDIIRPLSIRSTESGTSLPNARRLPGHTVHLHYLPFRQIPTLQHPNGAIHSAACLFANRSSLTYHRANNSAEPDPITSRPLGALSVPRNP